PEQTDDLALADLERHVVEGGPLPGRQAPVDLREVPSSDHGSSAGQQGDGGFWSGFDTPGQLSIGSGTPSPSLSFGSGAPSGGSAWRLISIGGSAWPPVRWVTPHPSERTCPSASWPCTTARLGVSRSAT